MTLYSGPGVESHRTFLTEESHKRAPTVRLQAFLLKEKGRAMQEEIGMTAGALWQALNTKGELSLAQLKKDVKGKPPIFDWAIGWLAREGKIVITPSWR